MNLVAHESQLTVSGDLTTYGDKGDDGGDTVYVERRFCGGCGSPIVSALVDQGNTVVVIEHSLDVIAAADHVIDLGPEGGSGGGHVIATGTPEEVAAVKASHTGQALKNQLRT